MASVERLAKLEGALDVLADPPSPVCPKVVIGKVVDVETLMDVLEVETEILLLVELVEVVSETVVEVEIEVEVDWLVELVEVEIELDVELVEVVMLDALISTVVPTQPDDVPPTEVVCNDHEATPALVS